MRRDIRGITKKKAAARQWKLLQSEGPPRGWNCVRLRFEYLRDAYELFCVAGEAQELKAMSCCFVYRTTPDASTVDAEFWFPSIAQRFMFESWRSVQACPGERLADIEADP
jgi:hypothetical protein